MNRPKILAIQFKYLGDAVFITPALMALKQQYPEAEIHVLVAKEVAPLFMHLPWIKRVWAFPRVRGKIRISESWPFILDLKRERFGRSVDFAGNDRGAILSFFIGAKIRLSPIEFKPTLLQKIAYTQTIAIELLPVSWIKRHLSMLELAWQTPVPESPQMEIKSNPGLVTNAQNLLQKHTIICHIGTSQLKKEWPVNRWHEFYQLASKAGYQLAFSAGTNEREQGLLAELKALAPEVFTLPPLTDLALFLAVLNQADLVIVGDTGPLHFAAGMGVKVIGLFGTENSVCEAAPLYADDQLVMGKTCTCTHSLKNFSTCQSPSSCMSSISAERVFESVLKTWPI